MRVWLRAFVRLVFTYTGATNVCSADGELFDAGVRSEEENLGVWSRDEVTWIDFERSRVS